MIRAMRRRPVRPALPALAVVAALAVGPGPAAQAKDGPTSTHRIAQFVWAAEFPPGWRQLERQEASAFAGRLFGDTAVESIAAAELTVFGEIDRWRTEGTRGGALAVVVRDGERVADDALVEELERFYRSLAGDRCEVLSAGLSSVGKAVHPVVELSRRITPADGSPPFRTLDVVASTSGKLLILSFRAWQNEFVEVEPGLRAIASSLSFARPPRKPGEFGDRLLQAAVFGGFLLVGLFGLRALLRRRPPEHLLPSDRDRGTGSGSPE